MARRTHQLTRALLLASALLLALLGGAPAEPAPGWALPVPAADGVLHLDEAPAELGEAAVAVVLAAGRWATVLAGPAALALALVLRRRRTPARTPSRPDPWPAPAKRPPPLVLA